MRRSDERIVEHLYNDGRELIQSPANIAANIEYKPSTVRERLPLLRKVGLIKYYDRDRSLYQIAKYGRRWVQNKLTCHEKAKLEKKLLG